MLWPQLPAVASGSRVGDPLLLDDGNLALGVEALSDTAVPPKGNPKVAYCLITKELTGGGVDDSSGFNREG
ncbi:MAG: hypothetical protein CM1200mP41_27410 [Gammaproteobacteria bacterium]|nr:MAG: hypothetical protein CM1200mP41_27410 [Gammaproteobacteria bacterium]